MAKKWSGRVEQLLRLEDPEELAIAFLELTSERRSQKAPKPPICAIEKNFNLAYDFHFNLMGGGLSSVLYNQEEVLPEVVAALRAIGAEESAAAAAWLLEECRKVSKKKAAAAKTLGEYLGLFDEKRMQALDGELDDSESWEKAAQYLEAHRKELAEAFSVAWAE